MFQVTIKHEDGRLQRISCNTAIDKEGTKLSVQIVGAANQLFSALRWFGEQDITVRVAPSPTGFSVRFAPYKPSKTKSRKS